MAVEACFVQAPAGANPHCPVLFPAWMEQPWAGLSLPLRGTGLLSREIPWPPTPPENPCKALQSDSSVTAFREEEPLVM